MTVNSDIIAFVPLHYTFWSFYSLSQTFNVQVLKSFNIPTYYLIQKLSPEVLTKQKNVLVPETFFFLKFSSSTVPLKDAAKDLREVVIQPTQNLEPVGF